MLIICECIKVETEKLILVVNTEILQENIRKIKALIFGYMLIIKYLFQKV